MRTKRWLLLTLLLVLMPASVQGQRRFRHDGRAGNPWSFAPYAGVFKDALDISLDGENTGWMAGFRVGYATGARARLLANVGYAESDDVAAAPLLVDRNVYDNQYIITTGGAEYDIIPGPTSVSLGLELGGMWRQVALDHPIGTPAPGDDLESGYSFNFTVLPGLTLRHAFTPRTALELAVRDFILPEDEVDHSPALALGMRFR
jgi:hypothetical protein